MSVVANVCAIPGTILGFLVLWLLTGEPPALAPR